MNFSHQCWSSLVPRTLLSILANLNNSEVLMISIPLLISDFSSLFSKLFGTVHQSASICLFIYLFILHSLVHWNSKIYKTANSLFKVWSRLGDPFVSQNPRGVSVSFFRTDSELCIYYLFVWSNFNFLHNS